MISGRRIVPGRTGRTRPRSKTLAIQFAASIVRHSYDAIVSKTLDGIITSWNPAAERMFGYKPAEVIGQPMTILFPPDRLDEEKHILSRIVRGERVDHFETIRLRKDGVALHVSVTISPVRDAAGAIVGASKIVRDITAEKASRAQLQLASAVFAHTSEAIVIAGPDGIIQDVNDAFVAISGYSREDAIGRHPSMFKSGRQGPEVFEAMRRDLVANGRCQSEVWSRRKDGETYAGLLTVSRVVGATGEVQNYVAIFADITSLKQKQDLIDHLAHHDALTGLPNRVLLADRIGQSIAASRHTGRSFAVLYLDLDDFKSINERHGHDAGDEFLGELVRRMQAELREVDSLARIGGDEFAIALADIGDTAACEASIQRILRACSKPVRIQGEWLQVSASIGYTMYPDDRVDPEQLLRHADHAMYEAKQSGRNQACRFDPARDAAMQMRSTMVTRLSAALENGELLLHYQPKVNMRTGTVVGVEALLRWNHPERGLLQPGAFLGDTVGSALSWRIDHWVIANVLAQLQEWQRDGFACAASVNISGDGLQRPGFVDALKDTLDRFPAIDPGTLEFEIVESTALDDVNNAGRVMERCHALGVRFAIDDFGTGYSSLTYLRRLPAETLKIDQTFVRDMLEDAGDLAIVKGVIGLASVFGRSVIAEGVETVAHGIKLIEMGCEFAQGYGIARPMPAHVLPAWVRQWAPPGPWNGTVPQDGILA